MMRNWQAIDSGDLADWMTVGAYLFAAILSAQAASQARRRDEKRERTFWRATSVMIFLLGLNELLDLQTLLTSIGRAHARANDWYWQRREVQYAFVMVLAAIVVSVGCAVLWITRRSHSAVRLAQAGLALVGAFVLTRAASFHHVDEILRYGMQDFTLGSLQEIAGIFIVAAAALLYTRRPQRTS